jgi:hypothetical protein
METPSEIVCKPTPWFLLRAGVMLAMFSVFAFLFYKDGSTGYREKNESFYLHKSFEAASNQFAEMDGKGDLTPEQWKAFAEQQTVALPEDASILPKDLPRPMPWPGLLHDYEKMKPLQWKLLWQEYTKERGMDVEPPEHSYDAGKIREQWIVFYICSALALGAGFILLRTLGRSIKVDHEAITSQTGQRVPFSDLRQLDLRKWETKGLAFADYEGASGQGRIRIDGLTYGGFKKDQGEPAEQLMQRIRQHFSGELIEYAPVIPSESAGLKS